jgi:hypothetical protein
MAVLPGRTDAVAVSLYCKGVSPRHAGVAVYDNGVARRNRTQGHTGSNRITAGGERNVLYGYNNETTEFGLRRLVADRKGIREEKVWPGAVSGFNTDITYAGGRVYHSGGAVWDVRQGAAAGTIPAGGSVTVDPAAKRAYYLVPDRRTIEAYDTETMARKESFTVPNVREVQGDLVQVGGTALAFRTREQVVVVPLESPR